MKLYITLAALAATIVSAIPLGPSSNLTVPREIQLQARELTCRPTTLTWKVRRSAGASGGDSYDSEFTLTVRSYYTGTMPFKGSLGMEVRHSPDGQWAITHYDYDFSNKDILLFWRGASLLFKNYSWKGRRVGIETAKDLPVQEYWVCLAV
ncbi:hypothetical protein BKA57DRAFT_507221 [Linnemannia elongata]|nr:hypothetical protein BKA57DRAFT_507221 [Linnemannia elongata]